MMETPWQADHSQLFTIRVWPEDLGDDQVEWRGKVQHVVRGEACYFREWSVLIAFLLAMLEDSTFPPTDRAWVAGEPRASDPEQPQRSQAGMAAANDRRSEAE